MSALFSVTQLCPTPCDPVDYRPPGSSVHGMLQARILECVDTSFSKGYSQLKTRVSCIAGWFFTTEPPRKPDASTTRLEKHMLVLGEEILKAFSHGQSCRGLLRGHCRNPLAVRFPYPWVRFFLASSRRKGETISVQLKNPKIMCSWTQIRTLWAQFSPVFPALSSLAIPHPRSSSVFSVGEKYSFSLYFYFNAGNNWRTALFFSLSTPPNRPLCSSSDKRNEKGKSTS